MTSEYVGIDLHRRRSVIVRQDAAGEVLEQVRIDNDPVALACAIEKAGPDPEVVLEATYGWYWAADVLQACGARVHLAHPLGVKGFAYRRVKNDQRDASDLADLRMHRLPEAWIAPPALRQLRELVRYRAKLVALRSGLKAQVHAVLAKEGVAVPMSDLFGKAGLAMLADLRLARTYALRVGALVDLAEERRGLVVEERQGPSAALESAAAVLVRPAESLHHSVDRDVRDGRQFHGRSSLVAGFVVRRDRPPGPQKLIVRQPLLLRLISAPMRRVALGLQARRPPRLCRRPPVLGALVRRCRSPCCQQPSHLRRSPKR